MRILILEDDELVGPMLARSLRRRGHECVLVTTINSAREFLAITDTRPDPECILTDRDLPDGNGWDWARNLPYPYTVEFMSGRAVENATYWHKGVDPLEKLYQLLEK